MLAPDSDLLFTFGGSQYPEGASVAELWVFDFTSDVWTEVSAPGAPAPRYCYCATYLPEQRELLIVGGRDDAGPLRPAAWTLDIVGGRWLPIGGTLPAGVTGCGAAWMPTMPGGGRAIVFGGGARTYDRRTYAYDPVDRSFSIVATASTAPPGRQDAMMTFDPGDGGRVLVFGGASRVFPPDEAEPLDDMWSFDGVQWRELPRDGPRPAPRRFSADAFDPERREWVLVGGTREVADFDDVWLFDASTDRWTELTPAAPNGAPAARGFAGLGHDRVAGGYRLFGGLQQPDFRAPTDGWLLELRP
ncbi:MAG: hypothetical protein RMA76_39155 [Deltaproteobacteria bacterium]